MSMTRDIIIGATGSIVGAAVIYVAQAGITFTKRNQKSRAERLKRERDLWNSSQIGIRQAITNRYLFEILRLFIAGNIFVCFPAAVMLSGIGSLDYRVFTLAQGFLACIGLLYFFYALGKSLRYLTIRGTDDTYLEELERIEKK